MSIASGEEKLRGFTLIEMLVVIFLIALMSGLAVLSIGDNFQRNLAKEAERFQAVVLAAADEAIYSSSELGLFLSERRYAPLRYDKVARGWVLLGERPFTLHELPEGIKLRFEIEGFAKPTDEVGRFDQGQYVELELFDDEDQVDELDEIQRALEQAGVDIENAGSLAQSVKLETVDLVPQINVLSSGEQTAFKVEFMADFDDPERRVVSVESDGFSAPRIKSTSANSDSAAGAG